MSDAVRLWVNVEVRGDGENSPEEVLHHALARLHRDGLIVSWSEAHRTAPAVLIDNCTDDIPEDTEFSHSDDDPLWECNA